MDIEALHGAGVRVEASNVSVGGLPTDTPPCTFPCNTFKSNGKGAIAVASGTGNLLEGNRMTGNAKPAIDLGADGRTPNDARDADTGANGLHNFPIGVLREKDPVSNALKVSGVDVPADAGEAIDIYAQSAASAARGAEPTDYVGSTTVGFMGGWSFVVPAGVPANDTFFSATITTAADGTSELSPICTDPDGDGNPDSDGDGLCDTWETTGIDADDNGTIDLTLPNASPTHKDLYVELDTMADGAGHSKPADGAIQDVDRRLRDRAGAERERRQRRRPARQHDVRRGDPRGRVQGHRHRAGHARRLQAGLADRPVRRLLRLTRRPRGAGLLPAPVGARARLPLGPVRVLTTPRAAARAASRKASAATSSRSRSPPGISANVL